MEQITVRFYEETYNKLSEFAQKKKMELAPYIRQLVELGLRIEEMSEQKTEGDNNSDNAIENTLHLHQKLLEKDLTSTYEMIYLIRYILASLPEKSAGDHAKILEGAKTKAKAYVEVLLEQNEEKNV